MKNVFVALMAVAFLASCGGNGGGSTQDSTTVANPKADTTKVAVDTAAKATVKVDSTKK